MIIPIRCVSCGKVLADKYEYYLSEVRRRKLETQGKTGHHDMNTAYFTAGHAEKTAEGKVLDDLLITKPCCRRHLLTHVDIA